MAVSLYGKGTVEGDTPVQVDADTEALKAVAGSFLETLRASAITNTVVTNSLVTAVTGMGKYKRLIVLLDVTAAATEAGDTLAVYLDFSPDGSTWINGCLFNTILGNGGAKKYVAIFDATTPGASTLDVTSDASAGVVRPTVFGDQVRVRFTTVDVATADNMSFTWSVKAYGQG
jgi:hypothetical protein